MERARRLKEEEKGLMQEEEVSLCTLPLAPGPALEGGGTITMLVRETLSWPLSHLPRLPRRFPPPLILLIIHITYSSGPLTSNSPLSPWSFNSFLITSRGIIIIIIIITACGGLDH